MTSSSPRSSSRDRGIVAEAMIIDVTCSTGVLTGGDNTMVEEGTLDRKCQAVEGVQAAPKELGPIRLPTRNAGDFIDEFNQLYCSLGLQLRRLTKKVPDSRMTVGDLDDESSPSATDHRT